MLLLGESPESMAQVVVEKAMCAIRALASVRETGRLIVEQHAKPVLDNRVRIQVLRLGRPVL